METKIPDTYYRSLRRSQKRALSLRLYPLFKSLKRLFDKFSDDFYIQDLRDTKSNLYLLMPGDSKFDYRSIQVETNIRKFNHSKREHLEKPIELVVNHYASIYPPETVATERRTIRAISHGVRNGTEVDLFKELIGSRYPNNAARIIGTDISPAVLAHPDCIVQDFHTIEENQRGAFDIVYSNSLDQSNNPKKALQCWIEMLSHDGILYLEMHCHRSGWAAIDPFCCEVEQFPMLFLKWFGSIASIFDIIYRDPKNERKLIFAIRKTRAA